MRGYLIGTLVLLFLCCGTANAAHIQYHWATPQEIYLWNSPNDAHPVFATFNSATKKWDFDSTETTEWREALRVALHQANPAADLNSYSYQDLWQAVLNALTRDGNLQWATGRMPSCEIYLRENDATSADLAIIWLEGNDTKRSEYRFSVGRDGLWEKNQDIPIDNILGIGLNSEELRRVFDIPDNEPLPTGRAGWHILWDRWIKNFLNGKARPIMYQDARGKLRWLWRERREPSSEWPPTARKMPQPVVVTTVNPTPEATSTQHTSSTDPVKVFAWLAIAIPIVSLVLFILIRSLIRSGKLRDVGSWTLSRIRNLRRPRAQVPFNVFSKEELNALHRVAKQKYAQNPALGEHSRNLLTSTLEWAYEEYSAVLESPEFTAKANEIKAKIIGDYKADLGVGQITEPDLKQRLLFGELSMKSAEQVPNLQDLKGVAKSAEAENISLQSTEDWLRHWPALITGLNRLLVSCENDCTALTRDALKTKAQQEELLATRVKELEAEYTSRLAELARDLNASTEEREETANKLSLANDEASGLAKVLFETRADLERANNRQEQFSRKESAIRDVQNLSKFLRQWVQGFFSQQHRSSESRKQAPELRPVGVVMALANFSLLQMCFSIIEENALLRKGMAQNVLNISRAFGNDLTQPEFNKCLDRIEYGVNQMHVPPNDWGRHVHDEQLFRTFLTTLRADTNTELGTFFIDIDSADGKIVPVS